MRYSQDTGFCELGEWTQPLCRAFEVNPRFSRLWQFVRARSRPYRRVFGRFVALLSRVFLHSERWIESPEFTSFTKRSKHLGIVLKFVLEIIFNFIETSILFLRIQWSIFRGKMIEILFKIFKKLVKRIGQVVENREVWIALGSLRLTLEITTIRIHSVGCRQPLSFSFWLLPNFSQDRKNIFLKFLNDIF
jgi:hypothetical protein